MFLGPDTACFVMDPTRAGAVLARHAGIDEKTGQLAGSPDGGPRQLVVSSDFYAVYTVRREEGRRPGEPVLLGPYQAATSSGPGTRTPSS